MPVFNVKVPKTQAKIKDGAVRIATFRNAHVMSRTAHQQHCAASKQKLHRAPHINASAARHCNS
eukprot:842347-Lingulodinium_polyedra.AAC.1